MSYHNIAFYEELTKNIFQLSSILSSNTHLISLSGKQQWCISSDFIWPFLPPFKGVIPNQKMVFNLFILQILCIFGILYGKR